MDDVQRALEKAAEAVGSANIDEDWDEIARAAVLAFLKEMPNSRGKVTVRILGEDAGEVEVDWTCSTLAAAIEEAQG